jgi:energy-coupling factor transporter ATP-binding protein EcfA2
MIGKKIYKNGNIIFEDSYYTLAVDIYKIKGLSGSIEIPLKNGVYAITGSNGSGKSTILSVLSRLVPPYIFRFTDVDYLSDSKIVFKVKNILNTWSFKNGKYTKDSMEDIRFEGRYEGSLFYGKRFEDSNKVDELMLNGKITNDLLIDAEDYIIKTLGFILQGNEKYYNNIKRLKNKYITEDFELKNLPYFYESNGKLISQFSMARLNRRLRSKIG